MTETPASSSTVTPNYDLTQTISPYLDRHLVFPLLEFLDGKNTYSEVDLLKAKLDLLDKTNMVDFAMDIYNKLHNTDTPPADMKAHRDVVVARLKQLQQEAGPMLRVIENRELLSRLRQDKTFNLQFLQENHEVTPESLEALYKYAKFQFDCGNYAGAAEYLFHFRALNTNPERNFSALWGKLAAEILMQNWDEALKDLGALRELIDAKSFTPPLVQLQQRTWLIHWSLFVFFNHANGVNLIVDLFMQDRYLNAIQTTCPHVLRYLTTAVIINKKRRNILKDLVKVIQQEAYTYRDPITEFLEALYVNFDFEEAHIKLRQCDQVLQSDFFLVATRNDFIENARLYIFETYCRIHQKIDITMLAEKLGMEVAEAERWIVNLIRNARLDAKIDSKDNHVIMGTQYPSVYQKVIEKTKGLSFRSYQLATNLNKKHDEPRDQTNRFQDESEDAGEQ
eukprot:TRINITY_DN14378_c0_g1_i1.p1 TRINITY_DN14378_c0_g1~~TRINITY_DN14378_c0_g1_i1.p1  ORF type:complete len:479 (-),score=131.36 TRINITY_DN14378_c0_g1_i1:279-1634(-)